MWECPQDLTRWERLGRNVIRVHGGLKPRAPPGMASNFAAGRWRYQITAVRLRVTLSEATTMDYVLPRNSDE
jgi:hypothetical protein